MGGWTPAGPPLLAPALQGGPPPAPSRRRRRRPLLPPPPVPCPPSPLPSPNFRLSLPRCLPRLFPQPVCRPCTLTSHAGTPRLHFSRVPAPAAALFSPFLPRSVSGRAPHLPRLLGLLSESGPSVSPFNKQKDGLSCGVSWPPTLRETWFPSSCCTEASNHCPDSQPLVSTRARWSSERPSIPPSRGLCLGPDELRARRPFRYSPLPAAGSPRTGSRAQPCFNWKRPLPVWAAPWLPARVSCAFQKTGACGPPAPPPPSLEQRWIFPRCPLQRGS